MTFCFSSSGAERRRAGAALHLRFLLCPPGAKLPGGQPSSLPAWEWVGPGSQPKERDARFLQHGRGSIHTEPSQSNPGEGQGLCTGESQFVLRKGRYRGFTVPGLDFSLVFDWIHGHVHNTECSKRKYTGAGLPLNSICSPREIMIKLNIQSHLDITKQGGLAI